MHRLKSLTFATAVFAVLGLASHATPVTFGSVADFAPYNYLDDEGTLQGFEAALAALICARADLECTWALAPWNDMIGELMLNSFDVIMTGMQITTSRLEQIDFSDEYFPADPSAILVLTGGTAPDIASVVGAQTDTLQVTYITDHGWALAEFSTPEDAVQALIRGEVTAVIGDQAYFDAIIAINPGIFDTVERDVIIGGGIGLGLRQSDDSLRASLDAAIASLKADGTLDTLIGTWFDGRDPNYRAQ